VPDCPPRTRLVVMLETAFRPGGPVALLSLLKRPPLCAGLDRGPVRRAERTVELVALRGGTGRPDIATLPELFEQRLVRLGEASRRPFWLARLSATRIEGPGMLLGRLPAAL